MCQRRRGRFCIQLLEGGAMRERLVRKGFARCVVTLGLGLAVGLVQGCRKHAAPAPVQPAVRSVPHVEPDFSGGALPVEDVDPSAPPRVNRRVRRQPQVQPVPVHGSDDQTAAIAAAQREKDARLLQEQQVASQKQQEELNRQVQQNLKVQQELQSEPRIQEAPEVPLPTLQQPRIQDNPVPPPPTVPGQPTPPQ